MTERIYVIEVRVIRRECLVGGRVADEELDPGTVGVLGVGEETGPYRTVVRRDGDACDFEWQGG
jgi:hypothetical protein